MNPCGNPECKRSSGICGASTFGSGKLDEYGYWENPCRICADAFDRDRPNRIARLKELGQARGELPEVTDDYIAHADWCNLPAR